MSELSVFFIHGTGVRQPAYNDLYGLLNTEFTKRFPAATLRTCYWGDTCGVASRDKWLSVPSRTAETRALERIASDTDREVLLWARLYDDPLYELAVLAAVTPEETETFTPGANKVDAVVDRLRKWEPSTELAALAERGGIATALPGARDAILESDPFDAAVASVPDADANALADVLARAIVAVALETCAAKGHVPRAAVDDQLRDDLVRTIASALAGHKGQVQARSIGDALSAPVTGVLSRAGTFYVQLNRDPVFESAAPVAGDIVLYQARMEPFHEFITKEIKDVPRPLALLTHSLGGVMTFDMLALAAKAGTPLGVDLLITVGSQAPFLYELGASRGLVPGETLPAGFPDWVNIYAPRDFLSYRAKALFPAATDVEVPIRQPFPRSHGSYWVNGKFWDALTKEFTKRKWL